MVALAAHVARAPAPHDLPTAWTVEPAVVVPLLLAFALHQVGTHRLDARAGRRVATWSRRAFIAGWAVLVIALVSPLHAVGSSLFTAHMIQHELLMAVAAPLLVLGRPMVPWLFALPRATRRGIGRIARAGPVRALWRAITHPLPAFLLHATAIVTWHLPTLYGATLRSDAMHGAQHATFLGTAVLFWWSLLVRGGTTRQGVAILSLFATAVYTGGLGALMTLARAPWYPAYGGSALAWGLTPLEDQQIGGMVMWMPGTVVYLIAALAIGAAWLRGARPQLLVPAATR